MRFFFFHLHPAPLFVVAALADGAAYSTDAANSLMPRNNYLRGKRGDILNHNHQAYMNMNVDEEVNNFSSDNDNSSNNINNIIHSALDCPPNATPSYTDPRQHMCYYIQYNRKNYDILFNLPIGFHNHLSYYIVALWRLGANSSRMDSAYEDLAPTLCPPAFPSQGIIRQDNWKDYIGRNSSQLSSIHYFDYQEFYQRRISEEGPDQVFQEVFPAVVDGLIGDTFHGVIELGYAIESNDTVVLADGLAWMSTAYAPLPDMNPNPPKSNSDPIELLVALEQDDLLPTFPGDEVGSIKGTLTELIDNYSSELSQYDLYLGDSIDDIHTQELMRNVSEAILLMFASDGYKDFFIVHLMTSTRAVEVLLSAVSNGWGFATSNAFDMEEEYNKVDVAATRLDTQRRAVAAIWKAAVYVYVSRGRPSISDRIRNREGMDYPDPYTTWEAIVERTINIHDTHLQKVILLLRSKYYDYGRDPLTIHAALKAMEYFEAGADSHRGRWYGEGDPRPKQCDVSKFITTPTLADEGLLSMANE
jgi:hypothetical protein